MGVRVVLAAVAAGAVVAACSGGKSGGSARATPSPPAPTSAAATAAPGEGGSGGAPPRCDVAPASLVGSLLGRHLDDPQETDSGPVTDCAYRGADGSLVVVRFQTGQDAAAFARARAGLTAHGQPPVDVPGLGDEAYASTLRVGDVSTTTVAARRGGLEILVTSTAPLDREKALVARLFVTF